MSETLTNQIGEQLKAARLKKNLSLADVQNSTKIQLRYLEAIENNNLGILPGDFYVRAFIRQYALAVDLNPNDLLGENGPSSISRSNDLSRAHRDNDGVVRAGLDKTRSAKSQLSNMLPTIWITMLTILALVIVWFILTHLNFSGQQSSDNGAVSVSTSTVPSSSTNQNSSNEANSATSKKTEKKPAAAQIKLGTPQQNVALQTTVYNLSGQNTKKHTIKITAQGTGTNVKVTVGENILLNEMVTADRTIDVPADSDAVNVQFTNVINATMTFDGQRVNVIDSATPFWNVLMNLNN